LDNKPVQSFLASTHDVHQSKKSGGLHVTQQTYKLWGIQSSLKNWCHSATQKTDCHLWHPNVHNYVHNSLPPDLIL